MILPALYGLLAWGLNRYWLQNDLRHLYKELVKPQHRRYRDDLQSDYRSLDAELAKRQDLSKSIVYRMEQASEGHIIAEKRQKQGLSVSDRGEAPAESNLNLINRS